jgi:hypothetical protein
MTVGCIYKLTCRSSGKSYIGQTRDTKMKAGRPYSYGIVGRWNDHVSCKSTTPLGCAITEHGSESFKVETIESGIPEANLDEREAYWIATLNTVVPNGYNKMRHGRCRHRDSSSLSAYYAPLSSGVRLKQIKRGGVPRLIYAYLVMKSGDEVRVVFGQGEESSYESAIRDAKKFLEAFTTVPIDADPRILNPVASEYETKLDRFNGRNVIRIRIAKCNTLAAVYVDNDRICFGGIKSTYEEAVDKALAFASALYIRHPEASFKNDASKSATGGCPTS